MFICFARLMTSLEEFFVNDMNTKIEFGLLLTQDADTWHEVCRRQWDR